MFRYEHKAVFHINNILLTTVEESIFSTELALTILLLSFI